MWGFRQRDWFWPRNVQPITLFDSRSVMILIVSVWSGPDGGSLVIKSIVRFVLVAASSPCHHDSKCFPTPCHAVPKKRQNSIILGLILPACRHRLAKRPRWRALLKQIIQLRVGDVPRLGNVNPGQDKADDAEAAEDQSDLAPEVALVRVEHVGHAEREHPRHEGIDEETETQRF